mgnify:CR=1 FL=1
MLVFGESILNDATAIVLTTTIVGKEMSFFYPYEAGSVANLSSDLDPF